MRKLWLALLFLCGHVAHEWRNPLQCHTVSVASRAEAKRRRPRTSPP